METYEALGKPKFRGTVGVFIPPDMAFGKPSLKELQPSAGQVSNGALTMQAHAGATVGR